MRAVTRDIAKPKAQELASLGAEVVAAGFDDEAALHAALAGAHAIYANTNFWDQSSLEIEVKQGRLVNKLASQVQQLEHYIFSGLPEGRGIAGGKFKNILPYNSKEFIREDLRGHYLDLWVKTTELDVTYYYQNWLKYTIVFGPQKVN